jgi:hypothetical protein
LPEEGFSTGRLLQSFCRFPWVCGGMVGGAQSWELRYGLAVLGKSGAGEVQQRRTGQALGPSVRRKEEEKEEEGRKAILGKPEEDTVSWEEWRPASKRAIFGRSVCTLHFSTNDERHDPTNGLAWQTRTAGMGEEACLHFALRSRHDLHHAIGWWDAWKRVVNGVDCVIVLSIVLWIMVVEHDRLPRKAIHQNNHSQRC